jgi:hypothetical protein
VRAGMVFQGVWRRVPFASRPFCLSVDSAPTSANGEGEGDDVWIAGIAARRRVRCGQRQGVKGGCG